MAELALVSEGPQPMDGPIEPYIDDTTFISVQYHHRRIPDLPYAPVVPSRNPITLTFQDADQDWDNKKYRSQEWESVADFEKHYTQLRPDSTDEHVYSLPQDLQADLVAETCIRDLKIRAQSRAVVKPTVKGGTAHAYSQPPPLPPDFQRSVGHARVTPPNGCDVRQGEKPHRPPPFVPMVQTSGVGLMSPPPARPALSPAPPLPPRRQPDDELPSLTVRDVGKKLKALGLGKYAKKFSDQLIDGKYLKKLVEQPDTLVKEFKMTQVEILKLFTYVNEGHIPKQETQK